MTRPEPGRFSFANQLRGIAALCVVLNHLAGVYWVAPQLVADATFALPGTLPVPAFTVLAAGSWYNLGPFGVGLFFLISGFVIPISLERQTPLAFAVGRIFRIYPTYLLAFAIEIGVLVVAAHSWGRPFTYGVKLLLANAFLLTDIFKAPNLDLVSWTLTVELKFYLLMAVFAGLVRRGNLVVIFAIAAFIMIVTAYSHQIFLLMPYLGRLLRIFESNAVYLLFMLIGVVFSYHVRDRIRAIVAVPAIAVLFALFFLCWPMTFFRGEYPSAPINYGYALIVFSAAYLLRERIPDTRIGSFFAAISYPLYLVHTLIGFSVMNLLLAAHVGPALALLAGFAAAIALATGLHFAIELPSQRLGKLLGARVSAR